LTRPLSWLIAFLAVAGPAAPGARTAATVLPRAPQAVSADPAVLQLLATLAPSAHVLSALATDIDQDHDLDLIAATDRTIDVWINDGTGHYTLRRLPSATLLHAMPGIGGAPWPGGIAPLVPRGTPPDANAERWCLSLPVDRRTGIPTSSSDARRDALGAPAPGRAPPQPGVV